jgi:hypothetical protein
MIGVFNLVSAFSVTMWVHLHYGDDGLQQLLKWLSSHCYHMLIEPQPWKCYKTALKRCIHVLSEIKDRNKMTMNICDAGIVLVD